MFINLLLEDMDCVFSKNYGNKAGGLVDGVVVNGGSVDVVVDGKLYKSVMCTYYYRIRRMDRHKLMEERFILEYLIEMNKYALTEENKQRDKYKQRDTYYKLDKTKKKTERQLNNNKYNLIRIEHIEQDIEYFKERLIFVYATLTLSDLLTNCVRVN